MNTRLTGAAALLAGAVSFWLGPVVAQSTNSKKANWLADGGDNARTSWQRDETLLSPTTVKGMKLLWTVQTDNQPRQLHNLFAPLIVSDVATPSGPREIAVVAGDLRQHLRHRRREGHADLEAALRQHVRGAGRAAAATARCARAV